MKGLNALLATVSTPLSAPIIVASRLRKGSAAFRARRGPAGGRRAEDHPACGGTGLVIVRADSAFYAAEVVAAIRRGRACFSITARKDLAVERAIASITEGRGHQSATHARSSTNSSGSGCPTPKSPRCRSPRSVRSLAGSTVDLGADSS